MIDINKYETTMMPEIINEPVRECTSELFNHFGRYFYASKKLELTKTDNIIDASCGCGYGSYSLAQKVNKVYGLDINLDNLEIAKKHYYSDNILYSNYVDFFKKSIIVNKIISLETFEHVPKTDIELYIKNLMKHLEISGSMFLTVPLGNNEPSSYNQWHCNEPSIDVLCNLLLNYFNIINIEIDTYINSFGYECQYCFVLCKNKK